jgi:magnesium transporter
MVSIYDFWQNRIRELTLPELLLLKQSPEFKDHIVWVDLCNPTEVEEELVLIQLFLFHPLAVEDCQRERLEPDQGDHFPKVEEYDDFLYVIFNPIDPPTQSVSDFGEGFLGNEEKITIDFRTRQVNAFIGKNFIVTHHYEPSRSIDHTRRIIQKNPQTLGRGPDYLYHFVIDQIVDGYNPTLEYFEDLLEEMETNIFDNPRPALLSQILSIKKAIQRLKRITTYQREMLYRLSRGEFRLITMEETVYYRNVHDHLVRITDVVESYRDLVNSLVDAHLSVTSNRLNNVMKVLTMMSTFFLPLTFITGIYGMNFDNMPELRWQHGYYAVIGLIISVSGGMALWFRRKGWLE